MGEHVLVSPLGFSPGAVTGLAIALIESNYPISRVITVGTAHKDVHKSSQYLKNLFGELEDVVYEHRYIEADELRDRKDSTNAFVAHMGLALESALQNNNVVHVGVTAGRSGMGALAALATNLYGADYLWHMWVIDDIEHGGRVADLEEPLTLDNRYLNPTVEEGSYELVSLPFVDLRPLHSIIWDYHKTGKTPDADSPLYQLFASGKIKELQDVFPAGLTMTLADELIALIQTYRQQPPDEQAKSLVKLGSILTQAGITDSDTEDRLRKILQTGLDGNALDQIIGKDTDKTGFWRWFKDNKEETVVLSTIVNATTTSVIVLLQGLELYLKVKGFIP